MPDNLETQTGLESQVEGQEPAESSSSTGENSSDNGASPETSDNNSNNKKYTSDRAKERAQRRDQRTSEDADFKQKYDNLLKEQQNERALRDRQLNEIRSQQAEFAKHQKLLQEISDLKKKSDLEVLKHSNPEEYQKRVMQDMIDERLKSQQGNSEQSAQSQFGGQEINYTQEQFIQMGNQATQVLMQDPSIGNEKYKTMEPMMLNILRNVHTSDAAKLLQNPKALFSMAVGEAYMIRLQQEEQKTAQGIQRANNFHEGTAKPVSGSRKSSDFSQMSDKDLTALKNAEILKEYNLGR
jgi:hypothetical protein